MKVLHILPTLEVGGPYNFLAELLLAMRDKGVDVSLLVYNRSRSRLEHRLLEHGVKIYSLNAHGNWGAYVFQGLHDKIKEFDVVHAHFRPPLYQVPVAAAGTRCATVYTDYSRSHRKKILRPIDRYIYSRYDRILTVNNEGREDLCRWLKADENLQRRIVIFTPGLNLENLRSVRPAPKLFTDYRAVTMMARFIPSKDQRTLIRAIPYVSDPSARFIFIGDGPTLESTKEYARELGVADKCMFLGHRDDAPSLLKASAVGVLSAISEGFAMGALQCMGLGIPVVSTDIPNMKELVEGAGYLFPVGDEDRLATQLNTLLNDPVIYRETAARCYNRADLYDIEYSAEEMIGIYESILAGKRAHST